MSIRKAILPSAGFGTRFLPATKAFPKEMLNVLDKPLIQYSVEEAVGSGIRHIGIITSRGKTAIEDHFDRSAELEYFLEEKKKMDHLEQVRAIAGMAEFCFIRQPKALGLGHAILMGETFVGNEPFAALTPDDIYDCRPPCTRQLVDVFREYRSAAVVVLGRIDKEGTRKYGVIKPRRISDKVFEVLDIAEKPGPEKAFSDLGVLGRYVFPPRIFEAIRRTPPDARGEIQITDAIQLLSRTEPVYGVLFDGKRYDCGDKLGHLEATIELSLKRPDYRDEAKKIIRRLNLE